MQELYGKKGTSQEIYQLYHRKDLQKWKFNKAELSHILHIVYKYKKQNLKVLDT